MATEFEQNILQSGACRLRECFFKHALAHKISKKPKKYLAKTFFFVYNKFVHGWIPEWPKGTDCKSAGNAFDGSNPSSPTKNTDCPSGRSVFFFAGKMESKFIPVRGNPSSPTKIDKFRKGLVDFYFFTLHSSLFTISPLSALSFRNLPIQGISNALS